MNATGNAPIEGEPAVARPRSRGRARAIRKRVLTPTTARIAALIAVCVFFSIASPFFLTSSNLLNVMQNTVVVGIIAAPLTLLLVARQVDLSVGSAVALAATTLAVVNEAGYGLGLAILAAMAAAMLVAIVNAFVITKLRVNSMIATLGRLSPSGVSQSWRAQVGISGSRTSSFSGAPGSDILGLAVPLAVLILLAVLAFFSVS